MRTWLCGVGIWGPELVNSKNVTKYLISHDHWEHEAVLMKNKYLTPFSHHWREHFFPLYCVLLIPWERALYCKIALTSLVIILYNSEQQYAVVSSPILQRTFSQGQIMQHKLCEIPCCVWIYREQFQHTDSTGEPNTCTSHLRYYGQHAVKRLLSETSHIYIARGLRYSEVLS